ncbi:hypothetical protein OUO26_06770 [Chryseobacterium sp. CY350]|nr:hypothetical protein [Chryseobacterium sp. CY350]
MNNEYDYKKLVSSKTEYFDIKKFYQNNEDGLGKTYETENGTKTEESAGDEGGWFMSNSTLKSSLFTIHKEFNLKGIIQEKWVNFRNGGGAVGIKYKFDDLGKLIKEDDTDKNFKITPQDVIKFCQENNIDLFSDYTFIERFIDEKTKESFYNVNYRGKYEEKFGARIVIQLDGNSGEIQKVICINGKHNDSVETLYDIKEEKEKSAMIYKSYQGKDYNQAEWIVFEEKKYEAYCKRTGRPYTPKNQRQEPRTDNQGYKSPFLADDFEKGTDNTPKKKKGYWG